MADKKLSKKQLLIMGGALFAMHFGASCMLYPVTWGKEAGLSLPWVYMGITLSGLLLPLLGYVALSRGNGSFLEVTRKFSPKFGPVFCAFAVMVLGPLYVIPRMSAATWDAFLQLTGIQTDGFVPLLLFSCAYYALTYWFVSSKSKIIDRVGKILFPALVVILLGVVVKGIMTPISETWVPRSFSEPPLVYGFLQGYATGDLLCSLMFGLVLIQGLKAAGIEDRQINRSIIKLGVVGIGFLSVAHLAHMFVGASTGGTIDLTLSALYTQVVIQLWGGVGGGFFNFALAIAALTTAVGLTASTAEYFEEASDGKVSYRKTVLFTIVLSIIVGTTGLNNIVTVIGPLLDACYPACIVLVLYYVFMPSFLSPRKLRGLQFSFIASAIYGLMDALYVYDQLFSLNLSWYRNIYEMLPLSQYKLAWVLAVPVFFALGYLSNRQGVENAAKEIEQQTV